MKLSTWYVNLTHDIHFNKLFESAQKFTNFVMYFSFKLPCKYIVIRNFLHKSIFRQKFKLETYDKSNEKEHVFLEKLLKIIHILRDNI